MNEWMAVMALVVAVLLGIFGWTEAWPRIAALWWFGSGWATCAGLWLLIS